MTRSAPALSLGALAALATLYAAPALAANKVWVSNTGADGASCGDVTAPCATFQRAHTNVDAGGDIGVLTPGDYGPANITKAVNITNDDVGEAAILAPAGVNGVSIAAGAGDIVILRGLVIDGQTVGKNGISISNASAVHIQKCVIRNFEGSTGGFGIVLEPTGAGVQLFASDTIIYNNGSNANTAGILIDAGSQFGSARAVFDRVHVENNVIGIKVDGSASRGNGFHVTVRDSVVSGNFGTGIWSARFGTFGSGSSPTVVLVDRTTVVNNAGAGVLADGLGVVLLSNSTVEYNATGASAANGGRLFTYQNNVIDNNIGEDLSPAAIARVVK